MGILRKSYFWICTLTILILVTYAGSFKVPLLFDDVVTLKDNPTIRNLRDLRHILSYPEGIVLSWRPLSNLTFALSYAMSGLNPWAHHLIGLSVHIFASYVLFFFLKKTFELPTLNKYNNESVILAGTISVIWSIHPVQTECVTYISQRMECLMGLFYLLTLYCFLKATELKSWIWYILAAISCFMGALSKEVIITAPFIVLMYDATLISRNYKNALSRHSKAIGLIALNILVIFVLAKGLKAQSVGFSTSVSPWIYFLTESKAIFTYIYLSLWPNSLIFDRGPVFIKNLNEALPYLVFDLSLIIISIWYLIKKPILGFLGVWFFIILLPTTSIVPIAKEPIAENRLYLPLISFCVLFVAGLWNVTNKRVFIALISTLIAICIYLSITRINKYETSYSIWKDTVSKAPLNPGAHVNLGNAWDKEKNNYKEAITEYREALTLDPINAEANSNLANLIIRTSEQTDEAIILYEKALQFNPDMAEIHNNLAHLLEKNPLRINEALNHYSQAIALKPSNAEIHRNFAELLSKDKSRLLDAIKQYELANGIEPDNILGLNNLAVLLAQTENRKLEAIEYFKKVIRLNPKAYETYFNLANTYQSLGNMNKDAVEQYKTAIHLNSEYAEAHFNLANLLATKPNTISEALEHYHAAIKINHNYVEAHNNLAILLSKLNNGHVEAIHEYELALHLSPNSYIIEYNLAAELMKIPSTYNLGVAHLRHVVILNPEFTPAINALKIITVNSKPNY